jgi:hypothetical protein
MLTITDGGSLSRALTYPLDTQLSDLLIKRQSQLGGEIEGIASFVVIQSFDRPRWVENALGYSVFENPVDGTRWGDPEYTPAFEFIEDHGFAFELAFQFTDDFTHVFFVENAPNTHPDFLSFCAHYASAHA